MKAENYLVKVEISLQNVKVFQKSLDILNQTAISCSFLTYPQVNFLRFPLAFCFGGHLFLHSDKFAQYVYRQWQKLYIIV